MATTGLSLNIGSANPENKTKGRIKPRNQHFIRIEDSIVLPFKGQLVSVEG